MNQIVLENNNPSLIKYYNGTLTVLVNIQEELKDEVKFKNSAFINTGRKVPTGKYTANEFIFLCDSYKRLSFQNFEKKLMSLIDTYVKRNILEGFIWNGNRVWLSEENQQNYTSWAISLNSGANILPLTAKFNDPKTKGVIYYSFSTKEEFNDFYSKMVKHIHEYVNLSRQLKIYFNEHKEEYKKSLVDLKNN